VERACFNSRENAKHRSCLPGTRVDILKDIDDWYNNANGKHIMWLSGWAGTGKSTIARTVARKLQDDNRLAASFFFSRAHDDTSSAACFATTIAYQLGDFDPRVREIIEDTLEKHPRLITQSIPEQWRKLVLGPLAEVGQNPADQKPLLLVIDALDECAGEDNVALIIHLLAQIPQICGQRLLVFLASRPEYSVRPELLCIEHKELKLQSVNEDAVNSDISLFISKEFERISLKLQAESGWPEEKAIDSLVEGASGLFIWAATACRYVKLGRTKTIASSRLNHILQGSSAESTPQQKLSQIYTEVLTDSVRAEWSQSEQDKHCSSLRDMLGAIILLRAPLSVAALRNLIKHSEIESTLGDLHSILDIPKGSNSSIRLHHPFFRDFLPTTQTSQQGERHCDEVESGLDRRFYINEEEQHLSLAESCLDLMGENLKSEICKLKGSGIHTNDASRINKCIPSELRYACCYWVEHLQHGRARLYSGCKTHLFLQEHLLHWVEVLSSLDMAFECVQMIVCLSSMVVGSYNC
jgi:NACHT domain